jgi:lysozyme
MKTPGKKSTRKGSKKSKTLVKSKAKKPAHKAGLGTKGKAKLTATRVANTFATATATLPRHFSDLISVPNMNNFEKGIDISHHNTITDWPAIAADGVRFVYIKLSEGVGYVDPKCGQHAHDAAVNGMRIGYYHFGLPDKKDSDVPGTLPTIESDARAEAKHFKARINSMGIPFQLTPFLDLEDKSNPAWDSPLTNPADYLLWVKTFIAEFGSPLWIYGRKGYLDSKLPPPTPSNPPNHGLGATTQFVLSRYTANYSLAKAAAGWTDWKIWQFTEEGFIGADGPLDLDIMRK